MRNIPITFIFFSLIIIQLLPSTSSILKSKQHRCHPEDETVLLRIKSHFRNASLFSTWIPGTECCKWRIVSCKKIPKTTIYRVNFLEIDGADDVIGSIPPAIANLPYLETLIFRNLPNLTGPIPPAIAKLHHLRFVLLNWNSLSGPIPAHFSRLNNLATLGLNNNYFSGSIPPYLGQLPKLLGLDLSNNRLTGSIPPTFGSFGSGAAVQLSNNFLSGNIPVSLGRANFSIFEAAGNRLTGDASFFFGKDKTQLSHLVLSRNMLAFDFGKVVMPGGEFEFRLNILDMSHNLMYGQLPAWLGQGARMFSLDLSYNQLCGPIMGELQEFARSSFEHNLCLCGAPLSPCKLNLSVSRIN